MDRDKRWERVARAYDAMTRAEGERAADPIAAVEAAYARGETDEFVSPTAIDGFTGMRDEDGLLCGNFRADRVREILTALLDPGFGGFPRAKVVRFAAAAGVTEYSAPLAKLMTAMFPPVRLKRLLGEEIARAAWRQLRIAETEKYAHVTYFFNGGNETPFEREDRTLVPSPKVKTYDEQPEMSAEEVTRLLVKDIGDDKHDFVLVNFANPDMVGHTGNLEAAIKAIETVDRCLGRIESAVKEMGGVLLITADHGNAEQMYDPATHMPHTAHTVGQVPLILVNAPEIRALNDGKLADVAPTVLALMGVPQPKEMTGRSLLADAPARAAAAT
jgi:2,3-bisphosphoglycerate-independent phosphoglycerate mutase